MPGYIAWVYVYGLSTQMAQADGVFNRWNEEGFRKEYYDRLVAGVDNLVQTVQVEPELVEVVDRPAASDSEDSESEAETETPPASSGESYVSKFEKAKSGRPAKV